MKDYIVPILIVVAVIVTALQFNATTKADDDSIDKLEVALADVKNIVPENANLSYRFLADTTNFLYSFMWNRYVLAPRHLSPIADECDTLITVCRANLLNQGNLAKIYSKKVLWRKQVGTYFFFLSCNQNGTGQ